MNDLIRHCLFRPYSGRPTFRLTMRDTGTRDSRGQTRIAYELIQRDGPRQRQVLFAGDDFAGSPLHADDADATVAALMRFLTLRPGDTDREYFASYTDAQRRFCDDHAEALAAHAEARFGGDA